MSSDAAEMKAFRVVMPTKDECLRSYQARTKPA